MFVTSIDQWQELGCAQGEFFAKIRPRATIVEVSWLIALETLEEIQVDAVLLSWS